MLTKQGNRMTKNEFLSKRMKNNERLLLDEFDTKILQILMHDCRLSNREIARRLQISVNTVINRLSRLEASGIIKGYYADVDSAKLGYNTASIIEVTMRKGMIKEVEKELAMFTNICAVYDVTGRTDSIVIAKFKSTDELSDFVKAIQKKGFVERTETLVVLNIVKEDFRLL